ncbi:D-alanyl-D-alanine carboxypeptidase, partial [Streptomyces cavourensis]|nr:D-alanyl-D-alanine carboxypeptidase [Streptomyces cavourensis]
SVPSGANAGTRAGAICCWAVVGGVLVLLAAGVFLVNRRWPVPGLARRPQEGTAGEPKDGEPEARNEPEKSSKD